ncbi:MAG: hypothetical protein F6K62_03775 [Sphaerospermopsis sp. SIO1G2]|nr:hypothetical protein [Sphaerospermopsis sp. SIO1G1]NET70163.1 hypothetical protein [Sphaerospermopsis sp. SIO1G2]
MNSTSIQSIKQKLFTIIKIIAFPLITAGIGLEIWNIQTLTNNTQLPTFLNPILILVHFALAAHFIEAIIAAIYAPTKNQPPIKYAIYTFFVGTVGLLELWENHDT